MTRLPERTAHVIIIDPDARVRTLIETVLQRAGFRTTSAGDLENIEALAHRGAPAVFLRDLNFAATGRRRALELLAETPPDLLRRTVVMTTARARVAAALSAIPVSAIVGKPFELDELVQAVTSCAESLAGNSSTP